MARRLLNLLTALSLLLCVAVVVLWGMSYRWVLGVFERSPATRAAIVGPGFLRSSRLPSE